MTIESNLYRILDGKILYEEGSYIRDPSFRIKRLGYNVYKECVDFLEDDVLDDRQIYIALIEHNMWDTSKEKRIKELPKVIENAKVSYFQNYGNPSVRRTYKNLLDISLKEFHKLSKIRYKYQYLTAEGIASGAMWVEMIKYMYLGKNYIGALGHYHSNSLKEEDVRDIALSNEWSAYSSLSKSPLARSPLKMTEYQKRLMSCTNIYKNVRNHPDFPGQKIMEDHDAFDGWMVLLSRKESAEKSHKTNIANLKPNSRNVFMGQASKEDEEEIMALNTPEITERIMKEHELNKH